MPSTQQYYTASTTSGQVPLAHYGSKGPSYSMHSSKVPSYQSSVAGSASSYAPSSAGSSSSRSGNSKVDLASLLSQQFETAFDSTPLDRNLASQAQTSGALNAKHRELLELQQKAQRRLASAKVNIREGMKAARETQADLAWTQDRVDILKARAAERYPSEYAAASSGRY